IVGGVPIKGPADKLMLGLRMEVSPVGVARYYRDFLDVMVIDKQDEHLLGEIEDLGIPAVATNTIMHNGAAKKALAQKVLEVAKLE
ncbi:MAG TPA: 2-phospho-L-lactate transferase, partial [Ktedonobacteraceae bacterium]|nr:2-phospho-L-lactate transferase [Ktedonobacteraceae bacterium]